MKQQQPINRHPSHPSAAGRTPSPNRAGKDKPSPAFDTNDTDGFSFPALLARLLPASGTSVGGMLGLVTVSTAIALRAPDPLALLTPLAWGSVGLSSLVGGMVAGRRLPEKPAVAGLLAGIPVLLLLILAGFLAGRATPSVWILRVCVLPLQLVGALLARPRRRPATHAAHTAHAASVGPRR